MARIPRFVVGAYRGNMRATDQLAYKALEVTHDAGSSVATAANVAMARRVLWP